MTKAADISGCKGHLGFGNILNKKHTVFSIITNRKLLYSHQLLKDLLKTLTCNCAKISWKGEGEGEFSRDKPQGINLIHSLPYSVLQRVCAVLSCVQVYTNRLQRNPFKMKQTILTKTPKKQNKKKNSRFPQNYYCILMGHIGKKIHSSNAKWCYVGV